MSLVLSKKAKCQGCIALSVGKQEFRCQIGYEIDYQVVEEVAIRPVPKTKCYKPRNVSELKEAKKKLEKK